MFDNSKAAMSTRSTPIPLKNVSIRYVNSYDGFSASTNGLLLYERAFKTQLTWIDAAGNKVSTVGEPGYVSAPYLSPDEKYAVATMTDPRQNRLKLWLYDLVHGTTTQFTLGEGDDQYPAWSPR